MDGDRNEFDLHHAISPELGLGIAAFRMNYNLKRKKLVAVSWRVSQLDTFGIAEILSMRRPAKSF